MVLGYDLGLDVVLGGALCFGFRVVLWIIVWDLGGASDFVLCFGVWCCAGRCFVFWIVFGISAWDLVGALCLGRCYGLLYLSWEVLCVLRVWCWVGRCFVIVVV